MLPRQRASAAEHRLDLLQHEPQHAGGHDQHEIVAACERFREIGLDGERRRERGAGR
jgi:hypothetical protein